MSRIPLRLGRPLSAPVRALPGVPKTITFALLDGDGAAYDLTGLTARLDVVDAQGRAHVSRAATITTAASGEGTVTLTDEDTMLAEEFSARVVALDGTGATVAAWPSGAAGFRLSIAGSDSVDRSLLVTASAAPRLTAADLIATALEAAAAAESADDADHSQAIATERAAEAQAFAYAAVSAMTSLGLVVEVPAGAAFTNLAGVTHTATTGDSIYSIDIRDFATWDGAAWVPTGGPLLGGAMQVVETKPNGQLVVRNPVPGYDAARMVHYGSVADTAELITLTDAKVGDRAILGGAEFVLMALPATTAANWERVKRVSTPLASLSAVYGKTGDVQPLKDGGTAEKYASFAAVASEKGWPAEITEALADAAGLTATAPGGGKWARPWDGGEIPALWAGMVGAPLGTAPANVPDETDEWEALLDLQQAYPSAQIVFGSRAYKVLTNTYVCTSPLRLRGTGTTEIYSDVADSYILSMSATYDILGIHFREWNDMLTLNPATAGGIYGPRLRFCRFSDCAGHIFTINTAQQHTLVEGGEITGVTVSDHNGSAFDLDGRTRRWSVSYLSGERFTNDGAVSTSNTVLLQLGNGINTVPPYEIIWGTEDQGYHTIRGLVAEGFSSDATAGEVHGLLLYGLNCTVDGVVCKTFSPARDGKDCEPVYCKIAASSVSNVTITGVAEQHPTAAPTATGRNGALTIKASGTVVPGIGGTYGPTVTVSNVTVRDCAEGGYQLSGIYLGEGSFSLSGCTVERTPLCIKTFNVGDLSVTGSTFSDPHTRLGDIEVFRSYFFSGNTWVGATETDALYFNTSASGTPTRGRIFDTFRSNDSKRMLNVLHAVEELEIDITVKGYRLSGYAGDQIQANIGGPVNVSGKARLTATSQTTNQTVRWLQLSCPGTINIEVEHATRAEVNSTKSPVRITNVGKSLVAKNTVCISDPAVYPGSAAHTQQMFEVTGCGVNATLHFLGGAVYSSLRNGVPGDGSGEGAPTTRFAGLAKVSAVPRLVVVRDFTGIDFNSNLLDVASGAIGRVDVAGCSLPTTWIGTQIVANQGAVVDLNITGNIQ